MSHCRGGCEETRDSQGWVTRQHCSLATKCDRAAVESSSRWEGWNMAVVTAGMRWYARVALPAHMEVPVSTGPGAELCATSVLVCGGEISQGATAVLSGAPQRRSRLSR